MKRPTAARPAPTPSAAEAPAALGAPALRTFENVADRWRLSGVERERVLGLSHSKYHRLRAGLKRDPVRIVLSADTLERVSHVLGIYKALQILFPDRERADGWIDRPSRRLGGEPARTRLVSGRFTDLVDVRRYLDAARGW